MEKKKPKLRCGVILKPPKNKSYKPNEIKLLGKRFRKVDLRGALIGTGYDTRQKLLYRNLEGVNIYIRHCHMKNSWRSMHWSNMIHWQLIKHVE